MLKGLADPSTKNLAVFELFLTIFEWFVTRHVTQAYTHVYSTCRHATIPTAKRFSNASNVACHNLQSFIAVSAWGHFSFPAAIQK